MTVAIARVEIARRGRLPLTESSHGNQPPSADAATSLKSLVGRAQHGDADAFGRMVEPLSLRLSLFIKRVGTRALGPDQDDQDLLQVVLARAWNLLPTYQHLGEDGFYRWLVALARGAVADRRKYLDAKGRGATRHLESAVDGGDFVCVPQELSTSISRMASRREEHARAAAALAALPENYREVVEPHLLEARSLREIADGLGISRNAVWERLHRGLALMRARLA